MAEPPIGAKLRTALEDKGWSYTRLIAEMRKVAGRQGKTLPTTASLMAMLSRWWRWAARPTASARPPACGRLPAASSAPTAVPATASSAASAGRPTAPAGPTGPTERVARSRSGRRPPTPTDPLPIATGPGD